MSTPLLRLFVYGTLKRGGRYHERFCSGAPSIEPAQTLGTLGWLPAGYPVLAVPDSAILAHGTADPIADLRAQQETTAIASLGAESESDAALGSVLSAAVAGELIAFADPARRLPAIDAFEDFHPGGDSLYWRVLISVWTAHGNGVTAWAYVGLAPRSQPARSCNRRT